MAKPPVILTLDTSGPFVTAGVSTFAHKAVFEDMARGQAERLGGMCNEVLHDCGIDWSDLDAIAVGVGPGNFTGIRIAVSFARGAALGLGIPTIGVSAFEVMKQGVGFSNRVLLSLPAPQGKAYVQPFLANRPLAEPMMITPGEVLPDMEHPGLSVWGFEADKIAQPLGAQVFEDPSIADPALLCVRIAHIAMTKFRDDPQPPRAKPLYVKPADAAPPREAPPVILP